MTQRGGAVVEFALVVPLVLLLVLALVEIAVVARVQLEVVYAARAGAREAAVSPDPARAVRAVRAALGAAGARARVSVRRPHVVGGRARVEVVLAHRVTVPFLRRVTIPVRAAATMRVER